MKSKQDALSRWPIPIFLVWSRCPLLPTVLSSAPSCIPCTRYRTSSTCSPIPLRTGPLLWTAQRQKSSTTKKWIISDTCFNNNQNVNSLHSPITLAATWSNLVCSWGGRSWQTLCIRQTFSSVLNTRDSDWTSCSTFLNGNYSLVLCSSRGKTRKPIVFVLLQTTSHCLPLPCCQ